jgi:tight adherence protein B
VGELVAAFAAVGAASGAFLVAIAIGRTVAARQERRRRAERFLTIEPSRPGPIVDAGPRTERAAESWRGAPRVVAYGTPLVGGLLALALLVGGAVLLHPVAGVVLAVASLIVPLWLARSAAAGRRDQLEAQLAPALEMMAAAMESGYSVQQALDRVVRDFPPPLSDEFAQVLRAIALGRPLQATLEDLAARTRSDNFGFFATIVTVQHRVGGDLPDLLTSLAASIRQRLALKEEVRALTAQARYSGWILMALPFIVLGLMLLANPTFVSPLFYTALGRGLLLLAAFLLAVGLFSIRTISYVEV